MGDATVVVVYSESYTAGDPDDQFVMVEVRRWTSSTRIDTILEATVVVDGEVEVRKFEVLDRYLSVAKVQRYGIKVFDELLLAHPVLSPEARVNPSC